MQLSLRGFSVPRRSIAAVALPIIALLASPFLAASECGVPITSGTGVVGTPVLFSGLGAHADGRFFLLGAGDLYNSGTLPPTIWLVNLGDLDNDGQPEYRIDVPLDGAGSWNDPRAVGCPGELGSKPPLVLVLHAAPEDLDKDDKFDVFEDTLHRNGILDPGEDRDNDGRLTTPGRNGDGGGCEGVGREDIDCDGRLDVIDEDPNGNGLCDPAEPLYPNCDIDRDGHLDRGVEDRNGNGILDDRPVPLATDTIGLYPYGSSKPTRGGVIVASVAWNGTAYDFDAINTPTRTIVTGGGTTYRIVDATKTSDVGPRVSAARLMALDQAKTMGTWRFAMSAPAIPLNDDVGSTRTIFNQREFWNIRTGTFLALTTSQPDGSAVAFATATSATSSKDYPLSAVSALPISPGSGALLRADLALHGALESLHPFDADSDGHVLPLDNCPSFGYPIQVDSDRDGLGDQCDPGTAVDGQWSALGPPAIPSGHTGAAAVYDPIGARVILYGGVSDDQTWAYDGAIWTPLATLGTPGLRTGHGMVYDSLRHRVLLFGGQRAADQVQLNDLWSFDGVQWINITPPSSPSPRQDFGLAFDSARGLVVLFGGAYRGKALADTWVYDGVEWRFAPSASGPSARSRLQMAYDEGRTTTVLNGGIGPTPNSPFNDTWQFDGTRWELVDHLGDLPPIWDGRMVYDPAARQIVLFGGEDPMLSAVFNVTVSSSAVRVFDGATWRTLSTVNVPISCYASSVAFDSGRGVLVYYNGCSGQQYELQRPPDLDGDGFANGGDNCPLVANSDQADGDQDGVGDACDNCVAIPNASQQNLDGDPYGDACDFCVLDPTDTHSDSDGDGLGDECDCLPQEPGSGVPSEVGGMVSVQQATPTSATTIAWNADAGTAQYDAYVGTIPAQMMGSRPYPYDYHCLQGDLSPSGGSVAASDASEPAVGTARYYLMSGRNGCGEGTLGATSTGQPRPEPYSCSLPHPTPPVIEDVQATTITDTASCPEFEAAIRGFICEIGFTPDMYTLSPGPSLELRSTYAWSTIQVRVSAPGSSGLTGGGLSITAVYRTFTGNQTLAIPDDGSLVNTPAFPERVNPADCIIDPAAGICGCSGNSRFPTSSQDAVAGDGVFTDGFVLLPSDTSDPINAVSVTHDCLHLRTHAAQPWSQDPAGTPTLFTIDVWDDAGNVTTWPLAVPITGQDPTVECFGDACACCIYLSTDPGTQCRGLSGILGAPGTGFEAGLCKSL